MWLKQELHQKEQIDAPADILPFPDYQAASRALEWTNRRLGGISAVIRPLEAMVRSRKMSAFTLLDAGCGGGDIDEALALWSRERRYGMTLIGIDSHPHAVRVARERTAGHPEINIVQSDFFESKFSEDSFDFVISSLLLHHLSADQMSFFLWKAYRMARVGVVLTDLRRNFLSYWASKTIISRLAPPSVLFNNDAPLSFRRAYTLGEIRRMIAKGGYPYTASVPWRSPFRLVLTAERLTA